MVNYKKIGAYVGGAALIVANVFGGIAINNNVNDNTESLKMVSEQLDDEVVVEEVAVPTQLDEIQAEVDIMKLKMFEEDAFEALAEVLAIEEIEDDDYEVLYDFMVDPAELNLSIDDERDIEEVIVQDTSVSSIDVDDKDATVTQELKVYYENADGDDKKVYLTVVSKIEDGEVEDQTVTETA